MLVNPESLRLGVKMAPTLATSLKVFTSSGSFLFFGGHVGHVGYVIPHVSDSLMNLFVLWWKIGRRFRCWNLKISPQIRSVDGMFKANSCHGFHRQHISSGDLVLFDLPSYPEWSLHSLWDEVKLGGIYGVFFGIHQYHRPDSAQMHRHFMLVR